MKQVLFRISGPGGTVYSVYSFAVFVVLAFYAGYWQAVRRCRQEGLDPDLIHELSFGVLLGGLVGARAVYVWEYWGEKVRTVGEALRVWQGGVVFYGAVAGAALAVLLHRAVRRFPVLAVLDALAPAVALGISVGRVGCFLNGCCYGDYCAERWLGVRFPVGTPAWAAERAQGLIPPDAALTLPLHPTQLYQAVTGLVLWALLRAYAPLRRRDGEVVTLLAVTYPICRFLADALRDDEGGFLLGMTLGQVTSLGFLGLGIIGWSALPGRPPGRLGGPNP